MARGYPTRRFTGRAANRRFDAVHATPANSFNVNGAATSV
jgi:hypothetical protein